MKRKADGAHVEHVKVPKEPLLRSDSHGHWFYRFQYYSSKSVVSKDIKFFGTFLASTGGGGQHWTSEAEAKPYMEAVWNWHNGDRAADGETVSALHNEFKMSKEVITIPSAGIGRKLTASEKSAKRSKKACWARTTGPRSGSSC